MRWLVLVLGACGDGSFTEQVCGEPETLFDVASPDELAELETCTTIAGSLRFGDTALRELAHLDQLRVVEGTLNVFRNPGLVDLGMPRLERVGGRVSIHFNEQLASTPLPALREVGALLLGSNPVLTSPGMPALERVEGDLELRGNPLLPRPEAEEFAARLDVGGMVVIE